MGASIRCRGGRLTYSGRISRQSFTAWLETRDGQGAIATAMERVGFSLFGRRRAARRWLWRELDGAVANGSVTAVIQDEANRYLARLSELAFGEGLPRVTINLYRLVVVPRQLLNTVCYQNISARLRREHALSATDCPALTAFLCRHIVDDLDAAVAGVHPSPANPLPAGQGWMSVGLNTDYVWYAVDEDSRWAGYHFVFEVPREPIARATRRVVQQAITTLEGWLPTLSVLQRTEMLRRALPADLIA